MEALPQHIITEIMIDLTKNDRLALLATFPNLRVDWLRLYNKNNNPVQQGLNEIYKKHFTISKKDRINAMTKVYNWYNPEESYEENDENDYFWSDIRNIPIIDAGHYKLEDYVYSITDEIYEDIYNLKTDQLNL